MRLASGFIQSRLGRRMLAAFVLCAMLPLGGLGLFSWRTARSQVEAFARDRLHETTKMVGMSLFERLTFAEAEASTLAADYAETGRLRRLASMVDRLGEIWIEAPEGSVVPPPIDVPLPGPEVAQHVAQGRGVIQFVDTQDGVRGLISVPIDPMDVQGEWLRAIVDPEYAWGPTVLASLPDSTDVVIVVDGRPLVSSSPGLLAALVAGAVPDESNGSDVLDLELAGRAHFAHSWTLTLAWTLAHPGVRLIATEPAREAMLAASGLGREAVLAGLATLWAIILLSITRIRQQLGPLEQLRSATDQLAARNFRHRVDIDSGDELEDLADSFNAMSGLLATHFNHLETVAALDRAILSSVEVSTIAANAIGNVSRAYGARTTGLLLRGDGDPPWRLTVGDAESTGAERPVRPDDDEVRALEALGNEVGLFARADTPARVEDIRGERVAAVPIRLAGDLAAVLLVARDDDFSVDEVELLRSIGDQLGVALTKVGLFGELEAMKSGALLAFARAVDAKSKWTNGHSERVTEVAVRIARRMGYDGAGLEVIHRGGLLHDIGKIGVPAAILDKPARLNEEEFACMKQHPEIGARILEPIAAYADVLPIVLQHHEKWDGSGYPAGLAGEAITLDARIVAVADVFDAVSSDRPYRKGNSLPAAASIIRHGSGTHFDPQVVETFEEILPQLEKARGQAA